MKLLLLILILFTTPIHADYERCIKGDFCKTYKYKYEYYRDLQKERRIEQQHKNKLNQQKLNKKWQKNNSNLREY